MISASDNQSRDLWVMCNPEPCDLRPVLLQARPICRPTLWRLWNHREVQQGPSSNNCSLLRGEAFPPLTQHSLVLQPTKHLSARLRGRAGWAAWGGGRRREGEVVMGGGCTGPACGLQCGPGQCGDRVNLHDHSQPPADRRGALHAALTGDLPKKGGTLIPVIMPVLHTHRPTCELQLTTYPGEPLL